MPWKELADQFDELQDWFDELSEQVKQDLSNLDQEEDEYFIFLLHFNFKEIPILALLQCKTTFVKEWADLVYCAFLGQPQYSLLFAKMKINTYEGENRP